MYEARILIVDDEAEAGEILCLRLRRRGFIPVFVERGEAALEYLSEHTVDIVLLDMKMPGMDGLETLHKLRAQFPLIPVIIISGHADMGAAAQGMELGAFFYLLKPVDIEDLCHKIEDARRQTELDTQA